MSCRLAGEQKSNIQSRLRTNRQIVRKWQWLQKSFRAPVHYRLVLAQKIALKRRLRLPPWLYIGPISGSPSYPRFWGVDVGHPGGYQRHEPGGGPFCTMCGLYMLPVRQIYHHFRVWTVFRTRLKLRRCFCKVKGFYYIILGV